MAVLSRQTVTFQTHASSHFVTDEATAGTDKTLAHDPLLPGTDGCKQEPLKFQDKFATSI